MKSITTVCDHVADWHCKMGKLAEESSWNKDLEPSQRHALVQAMAIHQEAAVILEHVSKLCKNIRGKEFDEIYGDEARLLLYNLANFKI